jgi:hypothetical protein
MGQFDSQTDAALAQIHWEKLAETPGLEFTEIVGDLVALLGTTGLLGVTGKLTNLLSKVRRLAGTSYTSNLIYLVTALRNDMKTLYERYEGLRGRIDSLGSDSRFVEAISALALRAMHTSVKERLKRMARIVVNGIKENDLEPENLDDMLRAATELTDRDIAVLKSLAETQRQVTIYSLSQTDGIINLPREVWSRLVEDRFISPANQMVIRSSLVRLQASGFGVEIQTMESSWLPRFLVSPDGERFLRYLQDIAE